MALVVGLPLYCRFSCTHWHRALVDKIVIAQQSLQAFIYALSPGAYSSITKVNFKTCGQVMEMPPSRRARRAEKERTHRQALPEYTDPVVVAPRTWMADKLFTAWSESSTPDCVESLSVILWAGHGTMVSMNERGSGAEAFVDASCVTCRAETITARPSHRTPGDYT